MFDFANINGMNILDIYLNSRLRRENSSSTKFTFHVLMITLMSYTKKLILSTSIIDNIDNRPIHHDMLTNVDHSYNYTFNTDR